MIGTSIAQGFSRASSRKGLTLLIYLVGLAIALLLVFPIFYAFGQELGDAGYAKELAERFNFLIFFEVMEEVGDVFGASVRLVLFAIPFYLIWKTAAYVGVIHALQGDAGRSFWEGVGRYTLKGLGIALLYLVPLTIVLLVVVAITDAITEDAGEIFQFQLRFIAAPIVIVLIAAVVDCMHDYARIHLVLRDKGVFGSWLAGLSWPFKNLDSVPLYLFWFLLGGILWCLPFLVDHVTAEKTALMAIGILLVQQVVQIVRTGVTVAWLGSEVAFFEQQEPVEEEETIEVVREENI